MSLRSRIRADNESLAVYSSRGPGLSARFDWAALRNGPGEDSMYRKRPHRFAFVPVHAWAAATDSAAARQLADTLDAWISLAKAGADPMCYDSNLGVIQRVLALSWGWAVLAGRSDEASDHGLGLEWRLLEIIAADIRYLEPRLGQSVPNNHLLADRFAAWYLQQVFPEFLDVPKPDAERQWCAELLAQTYADGGSFEHASHYHEFACEMGVAYLLLCRRAGREPDPQVRERVRALLAYQCAMTGPACQPVPIGNAVEDSLFPLDADNAWCPGSLRELYRALFDPGISPAPAHDASVLRAFWLLGGELAPAPAEPADATLPTAFPDAGLVILPEPEQASRLLLRTGPAPGRPLAAGHMHADLLSVTLDVQGRPLVVDPGTYTYRRKSPKWPADEPNWRAYFAGPAAHNGPCIDGIDPLGAFAGDFRPPEVGVRVQADHLEAAGLSAVDAAVRGGGYDGVRRVCIHVVGHYWLILDALPQADPGGPRRWFGFQFAPDAAVRAEGGTVRAVVGDAACSVTPSAGLDAPVLLAGSTEPLGGWVSPRYGTKLAATQARFAAGAGAGISGFVVATADPADGPQELICETDAEGRWCARVRLGPTVEDRIVYQPAPTPWAAGDAGGLMFDGRLVWIRAGGHGVQRLRWLAGRALDWPARGLELHADAPCDLAADEGGSGPPPPGFSAWIWSAA